MTDPKREDAYCAEIRRAIIEFYSLKFYDIMITEDTTRAGKVKQILYDEYSDDRTLMEEGYKIALLKYQNKTPIDVTINKTMRAAHIAMIQTAMRDEENREDNNT